MPFEVEVLACEATIDASSVFVQDKSILWGDDALPYNVGNVFSEYIQTPACGYDIAYEIYFEDLSNNPGVLVPNGSENSPPEIIYDPTTKTFIIEKCSQRQYDEGITTDPECGLTPYAKVFKIHFYARLVDEPNGAINKMVTFEVSIGNVCENDIITLESQIPNVNYNIQNTPYLFSDFPIIVQEKPICPVFCQLTRADGLAVPTDIGVTFTSPVFELQTANKALNGFSIDLKITCEATLSKTGAGGTPSQAVNDFTVTYKDECYESLINVAVRPSY